MVKKSDRTCKKGFPCGKSCTPKSRKCWANLSDDKQKVFETLGQFVNRIIGIGNDRMSSLPSTATPVSEGQKGIEANVNINRIGEKVQEVSNKYPILGEENASQIEDKIYNDLESKGFSPDEYSQQVENNGLFISVEDPEDPNKVRDIAVKTEEDGSTTLELTGSVKDTVDGEEVSIVDNTVPFANEIDIEQTSKLIDVVESNLPVGTEIKVPISVEGESKENAKKLLEEKDYALSPEGDVASKVVKAQPEEIIEGKMGARIRQRAEAGESIIIALDNGKYVIGYDEYSLDKDEDGKVYLKDDKGVRIPHVIMEMKGDIANIDEKEVFEKQFPPYRQTKTGLESEPGYVKDPEYGAERERAIANNAKLKEVKEQSWEVVSNPSTVEIDSFTDTKNVKVVKGADGREYKTYIRTGSRTDGEGTKLVSIGVTMEDDKGRNVSEYQYLAQFEIPKKEWDAMSPEEQQTFIISKQSAVFGEGVKNQGKKSVTSSPSQDNYVVPKSNRLEDLNDKIIKDNGIDPELLNKANNKFSELIANREVSVNLPTNILDLVIKSGRLKNQFETKDTTAILDLEGRAKVEQDLLGIDNDAPASQRPIYGHLAGKEDTIDNPNYAANDYGDAKITLKSGVKSRSSVAIGDSYMEAQMNGDYMASPINDLKLPALLGEEDVNQKLGNIASLGDSAINNTEDLADVLGGGFLPYLEVQIHGEIDMADDVESITVSEDYKGSKTLQELTDKYPNIKILYY